MEQIQKNTLWCADGTCRLPSSFGGYIQFNNSIFKDDVRLGQYSSLQFGQDDPNKFKTTVPNSTIIYKPDHLLVLGSGSNIGQRNIIVEDNLAVKQYIEAPTVIAQDIVLNNTPLLARIQKIEDSQKQLTAMVNALYRRK